MRTQGTPYGTPSETASDELEAQVAETLRRRKTRRRIRLTALWGGRVALLVALFGSWQLMAGAGVVDPAFTSEPSRIGTDLVNFVKVGASWRLVGITVYETLAGFAISAILGFIGGFVLYQSQLFADMVRPLITAGNGLPKIALAPLFVLWFGLGSFSRIVLVVSLGFFIVLLNTYAGLQNCDRDLLLLGKSLGAGRITLLRKYSLPSAVPTIVAGLQLCLTYAFIAAIVGEMLSGNGGLGAQMALSLASYHTGRFFAELIVLLVVATLASSLLTLIERQMLRWRRTEVRGLAG